MRPKETGEPRLIPGERRRIVSVVASDIGAARSDASRRSRRAACGALTDWCVANGVASYADVGAPEADAFVEALASSGSTATASQRVSALRQVFGALLAERLVRGNPFQARRGQAFRTTDPAAPRIASPEAVEGLMRSIDPDSPNGRRDRAVVALLFGAFLKPGSVVSLGVGEAAAIAGRMDAESARSLEDYLVGRGGGSGDPLFPSRKAGADASIGVTAVYKIVAGRAAAAGIDVTGGPQGISGAGIARFLRRGGSLEDAARRAGHVDLRTTARYRDREPAAHA